MANERVFIYQPEDIGKYAKHNDGIEQFLKDVADKRPTDLKWQFKWLAYLRQSHNNPVLYAGLMYLRDIHDKLDPLARIDGRSMIEGFREMATENIGAKVLSAEFGQGRLEIEAQLDEDFQRVLGWALAPGHRKYGLAPPKKVNRLILNLVPEANDRIAAFLESKGYRGRFQFVTLQEDLQLQLADPGN